MLLSSPKARLITFFKTRLIIFLSHNNHCFQCNTTITNFLAKCSLNNIFQDSFNIILSQQLTHDRFYISQQLTHDRSYISLKAVSGLKEMKIIFYNKALLRFIHTVPYHDEIKKLAIFLKKGLIAKKSIVGPTLFSISSF